MVVSTLAAVEDSHPDIYVDIDANANADPSKKSVDAVEAEAANTQGRPVTNTLRTAIRHLRACAGPWFRFRGASTFIVHQFSESILVSLFCVYSDSIVNLLVARLIVSVLLANLRLAWVHIVISAPSPKRWYQRIPGFRAWRQIAPVIALQNLAVCSAFYIPLGLFTLFKTSDGDVVWLFDGNMPAKHSICRIAVPLIASILLGIVVAIPADAIFVRVAASMLPEEYESIVPFDRSFGGKVVPAILGGSGRVSVADAWRTFDRAARVRFLKVNAKVYAIEAVIMLAYIGVLVGQASITGPNAFIPLFNNMT